MGLYIIHHSLLDGSDRFMSRENDDRSAYSCLAQAQKKKCSATHNICWDVRT